MMMHKKGMIQTYRAVVFLMKIFNCHDKNLRKIVFKFIIADIKEQNIKFKNYALNKQLQVLRDIYIYIKELHNRGPEEVIRQHGQEVHSDHD